MAHRLRGGAHDEGEELYGRESRGTWNQRALPTSVVSGSPVTAQTGTEEGRWLQWAGAKGCIEGP